VTAGRRRGGGRRPGVGRPVSRDPHRLPLSVLAFGMRDQSRAERAAAARAEAEARKKREQGFNLRLHPEGSQGSPLDTYDSLFDPALASYFANPRVHRFLLDNGLIDRTGKVIDIEANKAKLFILEQELRNAEKAEWLRLREEAEAERRRRKLEAERQAHEERAALVRQRVIERRKRRLEQKAARDKIAPKSFRPFDSPLLADADTHPSSRSPGAHATRSKQAKPLTDEEISAQLESTLARIDAVNSSL